MDSILNSVKEMLGVEPSDTNFDTDIITYINGALDTITDVGVGDDDGVQITGPNEVWSLITNNEKRLNRIKEYVYLYARIPFDPPANSFVLDALDKRLNELLWRINVTVDPKEE